MRAQHTIIREYANGLADGFLNDLRLADDRKQGPCLESENVLIDVFRKYIQSPETLFAK
jgi:hypothetical protein